MDGQTMQNEIDHCERMHPPLSKCTAVQFDNVRNPGLHL